MANLKEIRTRIASVKNTRQVTSAMKMVSAAKLRKAQDAIQKIRPYTNELYKVARQIAAATDSEHQSPLTETRDVENVLFVLCTSNKGLCGAFNYQIAKAAINSARQIIQTNDAQVEFLTIGKKGHEIVKREGFSVWKNMDQLLDDNTFAHSAGTTKKIVQEFTRGNFDKVVLFYNSFKNAGVQKVASIDFLPIELTNEKGEEEHDPNYILEPSAEEIIQDLMPRILEITFHSALLDSLASEHGARMTAMHKATDNATELIRDLTLNYNKARQAAITNEITEIVSGANALGK